VSNYPDDEDGAVLADLEAMGVDMTQPLLFEFPVDAPDEDTANEIHRAMTAVTTRKSNTTKGNSTTTRTRNWTTRNQARYGPFLPTSAWSPIIRRSSEFRKSSINLSNHSAAPLMAGA
jgi:hypothetical protein